ncbi:MAG: acylphosphatase [Phycisphaerales bacterium]|nr:acylphosphatase [Phycisphaerales bacterium]MCI0632022.1 acylphosphatase [Phycisphaerales bacterium]MCI0677349.1 acylphosphatase [Phycisphaerales bacterium]
MSVRYTVTFTGHVQGVNFRNTTVDLAHKFRVTGFVRNEPDGNVRMIAEGDQGDLDRFVGAIKQSMDSFIQDAQVQIEPATAEFTGFGVRAIERD